MGPPRPFFVIQIRKTAGTSLRHRFVNAFGREGVYPNHSDGERWSMYSLISLRALADCWARRGGEIRAVMGHFPLCATEMLDASFTTLTVLREPVQRTVSSLRFDREIIPEYHDLTLEQIYEDRDRFETHTRNHMTRMYGLTLDEARPADGATAVVEYTPAFLERAKQRLATIDELGFHDSFADFTARLAQRYEIDLGHDIRVNTSSGPDAPASLRRRIMEDNAFDMELYEWARSLRGQSRPITSS